MFLSRFDFDDGAHYLPIHSMLSSHQNLRIPDLPYKYVANCSIARLLKKPVCLSVFTLFRSEKNRSTAALEIGKQNKSSTMSKISFHSFARLDTKINFHTLRYSNFVTFRFAVAYFARFLYFLVEKLHHLALLATLLYWGPKPISCLFLTRYRSALQWLCPQLIRRSHTSILLKLQEHFQNHSFRYRGKLWHHVLRFQLYPQTVK